MTFGSPVGPVAPAEQPKYHAPAVAPKALEEAVSKLNSAQAAGVNNEIVVNVNGNHLVVQVVNRETHEVVSQLSPPTVFRMAHDVDASH